MIRYYKMKNFDFTNEHYYCKFNSSIVLVHDWGKIRDWSNPGLGGELYPEIEGFIPDPEPIEREYINATDNPYVDGFKYPVAGLEAL